MSHRALSSDQFPVAHLHAISKDYERVTGHCANCFGVAAKVAKEHGYEQAEGTYRSTTGVHQHAWNVHRGHIIDATANQFDPEGERVKILPPGHPERKRYRRQA